jgi:UDP-N-acetylmuramate dehydrogenase|tara:strand:+ start:48510 stop:49538 length:1029 start_codon:yes stop_codon:yes gene_type:complete
MTIKRNVSLAPYTTLKLGGHAKYFTCASSEKELREAFDFAHSQNIPVFVLGDGSNVLISDNGFQGLVIQVKICGINFEDITRESVSIVASAGDSWDALVDACVTKGLYGIENLSGIPGTVGATPVQNVGAYGVEVSDVVKWVEVFNPKTNSLEKLSNKLCQFVYRGSIFKKEEGKHFVIVRVCYILSRQKKLHTGYKDLEHYFKDNDTEPTLKAVREAVLAIRSKKFPDLSSVGTAGSFFKNPIVDEREMQRLRALFPDLPLFNMQDGTCKVSLAWLLDNVGKWKGVRRTNVGVFENQPLVLVHYGNGNSSELKKLSDEIAKDIKEKTGLTIIPEVTHVGIF